MNTPRPATVWEEKDDAVSERAADFFAKRRCGTWNEADQAELDAWLAESTSHHVAYLRVKGIAARADRLVAFDSHISERAASGGSRRFRYRMFALPLLAAASIALLAPLAIPYVNALLQPPDRTYSTEVGGRTTLKFADGTVVDLNTDTAMRFRMTSKQRTVWLDKGEAWFHVTHDAKHPFTVIAGRDHVTDIGTEFVVRRDTDRMEVALLSGRASLSAQGAPMEMLAPGDDAVATPASLSVTRKPLQELADKLAWRQGMLIFRNTRLADAVREVNRYNTVKLVIADPSIADLRFNGEIRNDNIEDFLDTAQSMMNLHADRQGKDILLSRAEPEKTRKAMRAKREP